MNKELNVFTLRMLRDQYEAEHLDTEVEALDAAIEKLEQPEIIRCKDCKYSEEDEDEHGIVDRWCRIWAETCTDDGYCNYAEGRKDG